MITVHKLIATVLGIGYIGKGAGTVASAFCALCWYFFIPETQLNIILLALTIIVTFLGTWSANKVEPFWGEDSSKVVIDEAAGILISLLWVPLNIKYMIAALVLFRFFDISKILFIRKAENVNGGLGVMLDDIIAGVYSNIILQLIVYFKIF